MPESWVTRMSECWGKAVTSEHKDEDQEKKQSVQYEDGWVDTSVKFEKIFRGILLIPSLPLD